MIRRLHDRPRSYWSSHACGAMSHTSSLEHAVRNGDSYETLNQDERLECKVARRHLSESVDD
jgi:hypothetical protein